MSYLQCELCEKRFYDKGQKLLPRYAKAKHEKTCYMKLFKKQKKSIKDWLDYTANKQQINSLYNFMNDLNKQQQAPQPISPSSDYSATSSLVGSDDESMLSDKDEIRMEINDRESCSSAVSISSIGSDDLHSWRYQNVWYNYDKDNNLFDEYGNNVGIRYKDELDDDWRIDYDP